MRRTTTRRRITLVVVALALGLATTACFPDTGPPPTDPTIGGIYQAMNSDRAAAGLAPLTWSPKLANLAGSWSANMAAQHRMYHRDLGSTLYSPDFNGYYTLGENVLVGPAQHVGRRDGSGMDGIAATQGQHPVDAIQRRRRRRGVGQRREGLRHRELRRHLTTVRRAGQRSRRGRRRARDVVRSRRTSAQ